MVSSSPRSLPAARGLDGVDVADDVGDGHVRRRQLFDEARLAREPGDRRVVAALGDQFAAGAAERPQRMIVDFAAGDVGNFGVEKFDQAAQDAALGLPAQAEQNEIVARQNGVGDLRQHGFFVAVNAGEERLPRFELAQEIRAHLFLHRTAPCGLVRAAPPLAQR